MARGQEKDLAMLLETRQKNQRARIVCSQDMCITTNGTSMEDHLFRDGRSRSACVSH